MRTAHVIITQSSAVWELRAAAPSMTRRELFAAGMRIGRDHIASTIYTIVFAYAGSALAVLLLLYFSNEPALQLINAEMFSSEIVRTLGSAIGLVLSVPITTGIAALTVAGPKADAKPAKLYNEYTKLNDKLISVENAFIIYEQDLKKWDTQTSQENTKYLPKDNFPTDFYNSMGEIIKKYLVSCNYPDIQTVTFNKVDFDVRINGMKKTENNGHGFRSFVNSIVALSLKEYMSKNANHNIGYLLIDSPTLGLDEEQDKKNSELMKKGLFNYLMTSHHYGQIIIMENIEHFKGVEIRHSNVIEFSKNGRQGFLDLE